MKRATEIIFCLSLVLALALIVLITSFIFLRLTEKKEVTTSSISSSSSITSTSKKTKKSETSTSSSSSVVSSDSSQETTSSSTTSTSETSVTSSTSDTNSSSTSNSEASSGADIPALYKGHFSSIEGTWYDDTGRMLTVSSFGTVTMESGSKHYSASLTALNAGLSYTPEMEAANIFITSLDSKSSSDRPLIIIVNAAGSRTSSGETLAHDTIEIGDPTTEVIGSHPFVKK
ncbi:MAG: hypothetical protein Q4A90_05150 [Streptococcus sp.]|nr:hypothetical protein [Streptococcus sp.]